MWCIFGCFGGVEGAVGDLVDARGVELGELVVEGCLLVGAEGVVEGEDVGLVCFFVGGAQLLELVGGGLGGRGRFVRADELLDEVLGGFHGGWFGRFVGGRKGWRGR